MQLFRSMALIAAALLLGVVVLPASAQLRKSSAKAGINNLGAPIPDPIVNGKRAFVSYELGDVSAFPSRYSGGPERAYSEFYTQMKQWGKYEMVSDPKDADLVLAIRFVDPPGVPAQLRLAIMDTHGHIALWGFVEQVDPAIFKKHRDNDFSSSVQLLVKDFKALVEPALPQPSQP